MQVVLFYSVSCVVIHLKWLETVIKAAEPSKSPSKACKSGRLRVPWSTLFPCIQVGKKNQLPNHVKNYQKLYNYYHCKFALTPLWCQNCSTNRGHFYKAQGKIRRAQAVTITLFASDPHQLVVHKVKPPTTGGNPDLQTQHPSHKLESGPLNSKNLL